MRKYWSEEETKWLIDNYSIKGNSECAAYLGRSTIQIHDKISNLRKHGITLLYSPIVENSKKCSKCKELKSLDNFFNDPKGRHGKHAQCINCYNLYQKNRYNNDEFFRESKAFKNKVSHVLYQKNMDSFNPYIGCTGNELKSHLEEQFNKAFSWENKDIWDIDHIIPISLLKKYPEKQNLILNYRNLQPLSSRDNIIKSNNLIVARNHLLDKISLFGIDQIYQELLDLIDRAISDMPA